MLLALFHLLANSLASQIVNSVDFFLSHHLLAQGVRIMNLVARELGLGLVANASFIDHFFTKHTAIIMTLLDALMAATRKEPLAKIITDRNWLDAALTRAPKQFFDLFMTTRTVDLS